MTDELGNCYEAHGEAITDGTLHGLLCHGEVFHPLVGWQGHAWVEDGNLVYDISAGHEPVVMPTAVYYAIGQIRDVQRYTEREALLMMVRYEHYGPWPIDKFR